MWKVLIEKLTEGKKILLDLIEQSTIAYDQREEWVSKLKMLKAKYRQQVSHYNLEMHNLARKRDNDGKLIEYIWLKDARRNMVDLEHKQRRHKRRLLANLELNVENYRTAMEEIYDFMNNRDVGYIAKEYVHKEQENFAKFLNLIQINESIERINEEMFDVFEKTNDLKAQHEAMAEEQEAKLIQIEEKLEKAKKSRQDSEARLRSVEAKLSSILQGVDKLFKIVKCSNKEFANFSFDRKPDYFTSRDFLNVLEENVQSYMVALHVAERREKRSKPVIRGKNIATELVTVESVIGATPCPLCFENHWVHDIIDTLQKVMTREEVAASLEGAWQEDSEKVETRLHSVSKCALPKARAIMQKRYQ